MPRKKKESLTHFNKSNILETAKLLFAQKGVNQTTMDDIAKEADYSKSTIYVYFKSKDEIYNHIVYQNMLMLKQSIQKNSDAFEDVEKCYYAICDTFVAFSEESPIYLESILGKIGVEQQDFINSPILLDIYDVGEQINVIVQKLLERGINSGYLRKDINPLQTAFTLWSSICGVISMANNKEIYLLKGLNMNKQDFLDNSFEMLFQAIINKSGGLK
jgi:AcrR family transcriptional regulator